MRTGGNRGRAREEGGEGGEVEQDGRWGAWWRRVGSAAAHLAECLEAVEEAVELGTAHGRLRQQAAQHAPLQLRLEEDLWVEPAWGRLVLVLVGIAAAPYAVVCRLTTLLRGL